MDESRVREIREEVERQRTRWNEMLRGVTPAFAGSYTVKGPVFRPHVTEAELEELLALVEENRFLRMEKLGLELELRELKK